MRGGVQRLLPGLATCTRRGSTAGLAVVAHTTTVVLARDAVVFWQHTDWLAHEWLHEHTGTRVARRLASQVLHGIFGARKALNPNPGSSALEPAHWALGARPPILPLMLFAPFACAHVPSFTLRHGTHRP